MELSEKNIKNFWKKVKVSEINFYDGTPCWEWIAYTSPDGYGELGVNGVVLYAHRISWTLKYGEISKGLLVLHKCDNPKCVNPDHLFLGTIRDNMKDKVSKGRQAKGDNHGSHTHPEKWKSRKKIDDQN